MFSLDPAQSGLKTSLWRKQKHKENIQPKQTPHLSSHQGQDVHLPSQTVFDRGHYQAGATENNLPLGPLVQLRLAFPDAEHAL